MASQTVPIRSRACQHCGRNFGPYSRRANAQRFCCEACRVADWKAQKARQAALDFTPAPEPVPPVRDQRVPRHERPRLGGMAARIVEMLRARPVVTNREFAEEFPPGAAWRTRISDARLWLERHGETIRSQTYSGGLCRYWIEALP